MAKLGSKKRPICVRVASDEQLQVVADRCAQLDLHFIAEMAPGLPPDLEQLERASAVPQPATARLRVGRNAPSPCGSGRKFKKCCIDSALPSST